MGFLRVMALFAVTAFVRNSGHSPMPDRASKTEDEVIWRRTAQVLLRLCNAYRDSGADGVSTFMRGLRPSQVRALSGTEVGWLGLGFESPIADLPDLIRALVLAERFEYGFMRGSVSPVLYVFAGYADRADEVDVRALRSWVMMHTENLHITDYDLANRSTWARQLLARLKSGNVVGLVTSQEQ